MDDDLDNLDAAAADAAAAAAADDDDDEEEEEEEEEEIITNYLGFCMNLNRQNFFRRLHG